MSDPVGPEQTIQVDDALLWSLARSIPEHAAYSDIMSRLACLGRTKRRGWPIGLERMMYENKIFGAASRQDSAILPANFGLLFKHGSLHKKTVARPDSELAAHFLWRNVATLDVAALQRANKILGGDGMVRHFEHHTTRYITGHRVRFMPPQHVAQNLAQLTARMENGCAALHPIVFATTVMQNIFLIHPFRDGNGRLGRLLFQWCLRKRTGLRFPLVPLLPYFEYRKPGLINALLELDINANPYPLYHDYIVDALHATIGKVTELMAPDSGA